VTRALSVERIVRWLKPSAESFAAAAAAYSPDLMLQLETTRRCGAVPSPRPCHECTLVTGRLLSVNVGRP